MNLQEIKEALQKVEELKIKKKKRLEFEKDTLKKRQSKSASKYYQAHLEEARASQRRWYLAHQEERKAKMLKEYYRRKQEDGGNI